jgi:hypothetical protein
MLGQYGLDINDPKETHVLLGCSPGYLIFMTIAILPVGDGILNLQICWSEELVSHHSQVLWIQLYTSSFLMAA